MGIDSDIYMDYPPRTDMFDIAEGMYTWARIPSLPEPDSDSSSSSSSYSVSIPSTGSETPTTAACDDLLRLARSLPAINAPIIPSVIPYHSWNVLTAGDPDKLLFTQNRYLSTFSVAEDSFRQDPDVPLSLRGQADQWSRDREPLFSTARMLANNGIAHDIVRRFEVFLPVADAAAVFVATGNGTFNVDMTEYHDAPHDVAERWEAHYEEIKSMNTEAGEQRGTSLINGILKRMLEVDVSDDDKDDDDEAPSSAETTTSFDAEDIDVKAIRKAFKEAGLTPAKLAVPVTRTLRRAGRRTLGTGRLQPWTAMAELETSSESPSPERAGKHRKSSINRGKTTEQDNDPAAARAYTDASNNPEISFPDDSRIPIFLDPETGNIGIKGFVSPSFLQSVQWTEDFLAIQTRFLSLPMKKKLVENLENTAAHQQNETAGASGEGGNRDASTMTTEEEGESFPLLEEVNAVVVFDFRAPW